MSDDTGSLDDLAEAREVEPGPSRGQGLRLAVAILTAGLVAGGIIAVGVVAGGGFAQTEAGLCRITWAPCTELSLGSVKTLSGLELPEGTEVISGFSRESMLAPEFRAEVLLPAEALFSLSTDYGELDGPRPGLIPAIEGRELSGTRYWSRFEQVAGSTAVAAQGIDADGRTVILFDTHPRTP